MTLQLLHSEFPYIWGKFYFIFYQCIITWISLLLQRAFFTYIYLSGHVFVLRKVNPLSVLLSSPSNEGKNFMIKSKNDVLCDSTIYQWRWNVFLFSVIFTPFPPSHHGSVWVPNPNLSSLCAGAGLSNPGGYKEMSSFLADQWRPRIWANEYTWTPERPNKLWRSNSIFNLWPNHMIGDVSWGSKKKTIVGLFVFNPFWRVLHTV